MNGANEPAFPQTETVIAYHRDAEAYPNTCSTGGLSKREHAAILLRVPRSGDADIDAMIFEANKRDAAAMAMQGFCAQVIYPVSHSELARLCVECADALLAELEKSQ